MDKKERAQWGGKIGFILAAAGSAIGLGNIWKFPGKAYEGGGGLYLLIYLAVVILIGVPVMVTELGLGRFTQKSTIGTFNTLNKKFAWVGWLGTITGFVVLCYYFHIGGWVFSYIFGYVTEANTIMADGQAYFYNLLGYESAFPWRALAFAGLFVIANIVILIKGIAGGIEKFNKVGMPVLFVILIVLVIRAITLPGAQEGVKYMLSFDFSKFDGKVLISTLGQAFFSLSLGMAIMITYGSYLGKKENIAKNSLIICGLDTLVAFMAAFLIVPAVFATLGQGAVGKGGGFAFASLAAVFDAMPGSAVWGVLFYVLLLFAALSSSVSIAEGVIAFCHEEWGWKRNKAIIGVSLVCFAIGVVYTLSQAHVQINVPWVDFTGVTMVSAGDWMENLTDRLILPLAALGECIFVGWIWGPKRIKDEVTLENNAWGWYGVYQFAIKFVAPLAIAVILVYSLVTGTTVS